MTFSKNKTTHVYLRVTDMKDNTINLSELKYIDDDVYEQIKNYTINSSDLYLTIAGTIGAVGIVPNEVNGMNLTENAAKLTHIGCKKEYLLYALLSAIAQQHFISRFHQVAQPKLSIETADKTPVALPPINEQNRIVKAIKRWFALIDIIEQDRLNLQETINQAKSKIIDLAIHGKLVPQDPTDEPASELLKRINPKAEIDCDNPQYGKLPNGWCLCNLASLCKIKGGKRIPRGRTFSKGRTPHIYIRVSDMKNNTIMTTDLKYIDDDIYQTIKNYTISSSDLYLTIAGTIGAVGIVPKQFDGMNLTENAAKLTSIICDKKYLLYSLLSSTAQEHFKSRFHQVAQPKLSIETANSTIVCLPPLNEQHRIVAKIEELFAQIDNIASSL